MTPPLDGVRVLELGGVGPPTLACTHLADLGANLIRVDRVADVNNGPVNRESDWLVRRNRRSVALDLKSPAGVDVVLRLIGEVDVVVEAFRPGIAERLGIGPQQCLELNPRLVYCRMTGWGQNGPYAAMPGHDINYVAVTGALHAIGPPDGPPVPPLNLLADYAGGAMFGVSGVLAALLNVQRTGMGQTIDAAMVDGLLELTTLFHGMRAAGKWTEERGANVMDGGAPFYSIYETADNEYVAVGAIEPVFFGALVELLGLVGEFPDQHDKEQWPRMRQEFAAAFKRRSRHEWSDTVLGDTRQCVTPVVRFSEAPDDPHLAFRRCFVSQDGVDIPSPAPRFGAFDPLPLHRPPEPGQHTHEILRSLQIDDNKIEELEHDHVVAQFKPES